MGQCAAPLGAQGGGILNCGEIFIGESMKSGKIMMLLEIAKRGGLQNSVRATTGSFSSALKISQQTASRWLAELSSEGLVDRKNRGVMLTESGRAMLERIRKEISSLFQASARQVRLAGRVVSGMHEGRFYLSIPEYEEQIASALGFEVFPGTLNLRLESAASIAAKRQLMTSNGIEIRGFRKNGRMLGGAKLYRGRIFGGKKAAAIGAVIIPYKSHYGAEVLELISPENLRKKLRLRNLDLVEVTADIR